MKIKRRKNIPKIPAMTTGKIFFMTASGLVKPMEEIPTEDFAVAKAEPRSVGRIF